MEFHNKNTWVECLQTRVIYILILICVVSCVKQHSPKQYEKHYLKKNTAKRAIERVDDSIAEINTPIKVLVLPSLMETSDTISFKNALCINDVFLLGIDYNLCQMLIQSQQYNVLEMQESDQRQWYAHTRIFDKSSCNLFEVIYKPDIVVLSKIICLNERNDIYLYIVKLYCPSTGQEANSIEEIKLTQMNDIDSSLLSKRKQFMQDLNKMAKKIKE